MIGADGKFQLCSNEEMESNIIGDVKGKSCIVPDEIIDTAGIRSASNKAEILGVKKTLSISDIADTNLVFIKKAKDVDQFMHFKNIIFVQSFIDIHKKIRPKHKIYHISSKTGQGIEILIDKTESGNSETE